MTPVDALTHHHHVFLKAAYKHGDFIRLHNTPDTIKTWKRYITFDPQRMLYRVYKRTREDHKLSGVFDNIESAMFHCRRR